MSEKFLMYGNGEFKLKDGVLHPLDNADTNAVNSPAHYTAGTIEVIDYIDQIAEGYNGKHAYYIGNVLKYVSRAPYKNGVEDLAKARWYLDRLIEQESGGDNE